MKKKISLSLPAPLASNELLAETLWAFERLIEKAQKMDGQMTITMTINVKGGRDEKGEA